MRFRPRSPTDIRVSAMKAGVSKLDAGCSPCAESYFKLAQDHGASNEDIAKLVGRRALLRRAGVAGIGALALNGLSMMDFGALTSEAATSSDTVQLDARVIARDWPSVLALPDSRLMAQRVGGRLIPVAGYKSKTRGWR